MIKIEKEYVFGWEAAVRGMRNPLNSWDKSDSEFGCRDCRGCYYEGKVDYLCRDDDGDEVQVCDYLGLKLGEADLKLMKSLSKAGSDHAKFLRMINVTVDITAPLYWWKEFDTYKVGTVANSCSTMHKIHEKEFVREDFSYEHLIYTEPIPCREYSALGMLDATVSNLNKFRGLYLDTKDKKYWWQMIQLLPSSYNQKRTVQLNYQVLKSMYSARKNHKLDEWVWFCGWIEKLPYFRKIILED